MPPSASPFFNGRVPDEEINQVIISGTIISPVREHENAVTFLLENKQGSFRVRWQNNTWTPVCGFWVLVTGYLYSLWVGRQRVSHISAHRILRLPPP